MNVTRCFAPDTYCIKVCTGCLNNCSYCATRLSRGRLKSKPIARVVEEFEEGLDRGYRDFSLIATDIGAYGRDQGANLAELLNQLVQKDGVSKVKLRNFNPSFLVEMLPQLREAFGSGKISHFSTAVQSGNNRILSLMKRGYTIEGSKEAIRVIGREFPWIQICTQLMVGFPTETEEEFQDTVALLDEMDFDFTEVYMFQPRPHTTAVRMEGQIPEEEARNRYHRLFMKSIFNGLDRKKKALKDYYK